MDNLTKKLIFYLGMFHWIRVVLKGFLFFNIVDQPILNHNWACFDRRGCPHLNK